MVVAGTHTQGGSSTRKKGQSKSAAERGRDEDNDGWAAGEGASAGTTETGWRANTTLKPANKPYRRWAAYRGRISFRVARSDGERVFTMNRESAE